MSDLKCKKQNKKSESKELKALASDIRSQILAVTKNNGGHLSSNLGVVETTIALHKAFDFSKDKLIFDVGHQCYAHKILSGRGGQFATIRQKDGLSGFPDAEESVYDAFSTGHAGTSISAALGMCEARDRLNQDFCVVAVVGDGALVNGLNLEALSATTTKPKNLIIILNDNGMSISKNRNGFYRLISKSTTKKGYVKSKRAIKRLFGKNFIGKILVKMHGFFKRLLGGNTYFDEFGFKYVGVANGNDAFRLKGILERVKFAAKEKAVFLHVKTTKGKGFEVAEESADLYHGVGKGYQTGMGEMSKALGESIKEQIAQNDKIIAVTAGMKTGTGLIEVEKAFPDNFIDVGIAEEFAVTYSAGMAKGGLKPIVAVYSTFMQRAYDQIMHDVCIQNLPVVFCLDRAGFVGEDGKTHQGLFDLSYLTHLPNMTVLCPINTIDLNLALKYALSLNKPVAIRYAKDGCKNKVDLKDGAFEPITLLREGSDATVFAVGSRMVDLALEFATQSKKSVKVVAVKSVKPLDNEAILRLAVGKVVTLEENVLTGGFGVALKGVLADAEYKHKVVNLGAKDQFVKHATVLEQLKESDLTIENLGLILD